MPDITTTGTSVTASRERDLSVPPHPLDATWFMHTDGERYGPFTGHRMKEFVREGRLQRHMDVIQSGSENWTAAASDPVLGALFTPISHPAPAVQPPPLGGQVSAGQGATVVQVTNNLAPQTPQVIVIDGEAKDKSPAVALILSILLVGLGQVYNGQVGKGISMFFGCILLWFAMLGWIIMIWSWVDAYSSAKKMRERYNRRLAAGMAI